MDSTIEAGREVASGRIRSINVSDGGVPKLPRPSAVIRVTGVEDDRQRDERHHGGPNRAVSIYSLELIEALQSEGHPIVPGSIGENLTLSGVHWPDMVPGARLDIGEVQLELTGYAHPCRNIAGSFRDGQITRASQKMFAGWSRVYTRVLREGSVSVDDAVVVTQDYVVVLRDRVDRAVPALLKLGPEVNQHRPAEGKWSPREIIGHLIDSASNNHQRFVRALVDNTRVFEGYDQERWVAVQRYHDAAWEDLVILWSLFNRHIANVMVAAPASARHERVDPNNFADLAWDVQAVGARPTLDTFMRDYVNHLRHHLRQGLGEEW